MALARDVAFVVEVDGAAAAGAASAMLAAASGKTGLEDLEGLGEDGGEVDSNIEIEFEKLEPTKKMAIKEAQLPTQGKIRYIPSEKWTPSQPLPKQFGGYVDKFGNIWIKGPSRTMGQVFEWDVQLSHTGKVKLGWLSRDGVHINVSIDGIITHK